MPWEFILQRTTDHKKKSFASKSLKDKLYLLVYIGLCSRCYIIMNQLQAYIIIITFQNAITDDFKRSALKILEQKLTKNFLSENWAFLQAVLVPGYLMWKAQTCSSRKVIFTYFTQGIIFVLCPIIGMQAKLPHHIKSIDLNQQ